MALGTICREENLPAGLGRRCQGAISTALRAGHCRGQGSDISRQGIEVRADPRFGQSEGLGARTGIEVRVCHQTGAASQVADLLLEVLNFIEVPGPVRGPLTSPCLAPQVGGIAQTFADACEIPRTAIVPAIIVTGGATDVTLQRNPGIAGIVEELLPGQDRSWQGFVGDGIPCGQGGNIRSRRATAIDQQAKIKHPHTAIHEVLHEETASIRRKHQPLGSPAGVNFEKHGPGHGIDHRHLAASFQRNIKQQAGRIKDRM